LAATRASIALIPNPTSSSVEVQGLESVDAMELYTLAGMRLQQSTASTRLSVEGCTPGTYVVKVYSGNDVFVEKLLVQ
ncbi:MAG: T9SS type A sorting domain-containing protein, partial [Bacteroidales bacterium]|nr:T9SS type A sorting domain-containing protein [Bacteroidales bacterium]